MPASEVRISGGTFLLSLTYCSNCEITERVEHVHLALVVLLDVAERADLGREILARARQLVDCARSTPSTSTLTVPSGQLEQLQDRRDRADLVEVLRRRIVDVGLLLRDQQDRLSAFIACSSARIDFSRPTNSGITMCG